MAAVIPELGEQVCVRNSLGAHGFGVVMGPVEHKRRIRPISSADDTSVPEAVVPVKVSTLAPGF